VADNFKIIGVTLPYLFDGEASLIELMLSQGISRIHIRKPQCYAQQIEALLTAISPDLRPRLSLHDHHELAAKFHTGVHLNMRNPLPPDGFTGIVSRSCHTLAELANLPTSVSYRFISPVFNSISKAGYSAAFSPEELQSAPNIDRRTIALGGVTPYCLDKLLSWGFGGAAMVGYLWADTDRHKITERLNIITTQLNAAIHNSH